MSENMGSVQVHFVFVVFVDKNFPNHALDAYNKNMNLNYEFYFVARLEGL